MSTLKERLELLIENKGISRYLIASGSGVSNSILSRIINEKTKKISQKTIADLANYFHVDPYWLQTGRGEMTLQTESDINHTGSPDEMLEKIRQLEIENQRLNGKLELCEKLLQQMMGSPPQKYVEGGSVRKKSG